MLQFLALPFVLLLVQLQGGECSARSLTQAADSSACDVNVASIAAIERAVRGGSPDGSALRICLDVPAAVQGSAWLSDNPGLIELQANQVVHIDCQDQELEYPNILKNLQMGQNSELMFTKCRLLNFDFSERSVAEGARLKVNDSKLGFGTTCVFVNTVDDYVENIAETQSNATFELGKLFSRTSSAAVHWYFGAFNGVQYSSEAPIEANTRYEVVQSTLFCGQNDDAFNTAQEAAAESMGKEPELIVTSKSGSSGSNAWVIPTVICLRALPSELLLLCSFNVEQ